MSRSPWRGVGRALLTGLGAAAEGLLRLLVVVTAMTVAFGVTFAATAWLTMMLFSRLHGYVSPAVPAIGYWTALALTLGSAGTLFGLLAPIGMMTRQHLEGALLKDAVIRSRLGR